MSYDLRLGRYQDVLADVTCDAVIVDAPYSAKTHAGHDSGAGVPLTAKKRGGYKRSDGKMDTKTERRSIGYGFWTPDDVREFVAFWAPRTRGWFVTITDDVLAPEWGSELHKHGRYVFAPLPFVAPGSRVRMAGDGPSNWTCWIVVARPRVEDFFRWGTLPGAYVLPAGHFERMDVVGGKPSWLMRALVRDYTRPGDLVCDPCAGGGTTLLAALQTGRRAVGAEVDPETHKKASDRLERTPVTLDWLDTPEVPTRPVGLFDS